MNVKNINMNQNSTNNKSSSSSSNSNVAASNNAKSNKDLSSFDPIAICGYSHRLPGGLDNDMALWDLMAKRGYVQEKIDQRYGDGCIPHDGYVSSPKTPASPYEGLIKDGKELEFDCALFGMSTNDAMRADPQIKMILSVTWEAIQNAGMDQIAMHNSNTGVFVGCQDSSRFGWKAPYGATAGDMPGKTGSMISNRVSYHFNWMGPSMSIGTACSSAITALDAAIKALHVGECDVAAFGAVNYLGLLDTSIGYKELGIISKTGGCSSFDKDADGYMRSEGAFMYILKRLSDAERDGDKIFGVIRGCGLNTAGAEADADFLTQGRTIFAPVGHAQQTLMESVSRQAGIKPECVDYVECHATGTQVGDKIEGKAIGAVYGSAHRETPLRLASTRSNLGHMEAASFASSLLKVLLMLDKRQFLPVSSHYKAANPNIPFIARSMQVQTTCEPFPDRDEPIVFGINSFGFGGANGHCLIEEYKPQTTANWSRLPGGNVNGKFFAVPFSAKSEEALVENARLLANTIDELDHGDDTNGIDMYNVVANLAVRVTNHRVRTSFAATSLSALKQELASFAERGTDNNFKDGEVGTVQLRREMTEDGESERATMLRPSVLMVFPGQGSQWAGCGKELYETEIVFRRVVDAIDKTWIELSGSKLSDVAFDSDFGSALNECKWAQPVTFLLQAALFETFKAYGVHPNALLGHSAGEAAAAYASGAYTLEEACFLVYHRSRLQNELAGSGRMLVLMQDQDTVESMVTKLGFSVNITDGVDGDLIDVACTNSPNNTVVCGRADVIARLQDKLEQDGQQSGKLIPGNIAFHSRWTTHIRDDLVDALSSLGDKHSTVPFISTVTGTFLKRFDAKYWWDNVRQPVNLIGAMNVARVHVEPDVIVEVSPHITLRSPIRDIYNNENAPMPSFVYTLVRKSNTAESFANSIGNCFKCGDMVDFKSLYPRPLPLTHRFPRYAMKRERVMDDLVDDSALLKKESFSAGPLLGKQRQGDRLQYEVVVSKQHYPWLAEHVVQEAIIPAAGYIELLFEAFHGQPIRVLGAQFLSPFIIDDAPRYLHTDILPCAYAADRFEFKIASRPHSTEETSSTTHCTGVVEKLPDGKLNLSIPSSVPLTLKDDAGNYCQSLYADADTFYKAMTARVGADYAYGPLFQGVSRVDRDTVSNRLRVEVTIDADIWSKWDRMGYIFHPTMLDGALQTFIVYIMEAADFAGVPQMLSCSLLKKPSCEKIVCVYEPPEYLRQNTHQKGQIAFGLGERSAGKISIYDGATEELIAFIGEYNCFHSNTRKADLKHTKHYLSWQPKDGCTAPNVVETSLQIMRSGGGLGVLARRLIQHLVTEAHPDSGVPFFTNVGECVIGGPPNELALQECISTISDSPVQYTMMSPDVELLTNTYQELGTSHKGAHLRFVVPQDTDGGGLLRPAMFELLIVRLSADENQSLGVGDVTKFVAPAGLLMLESQSGSFEAPPKWTCLWESPSAQDEPSLKLLQAPTTTEARVAQQTKNGISVSSHVVVDDLLGFASYWRQIHNLGTTKADFGEADQWEQVDYFAIQKECDSEDAELFDAPARLTEWAKQFAAYRSSQAALMPCVVTVFTSGAARDVTSPRQSGVWGAVRSLSLEIGDACAVDFRLVDVLNKEDLNYATSVQEMRERELCIHNGRIWTARLINDREAMSKAEITADDDSAFRLETNNSGVIADLDFRTVEMPRLGPNDVEIAVKGASLNFRDIMVGLGRLPHLSYERSALGRSIGIECAGIVVKCGDSVTKHRVGDKVITMQGGCIANRLRCHEEIAFSLPKNLSYAEGASVVFAYVTAYYSLVHLAEIGEGSTVLVHSAMGGVGQAAIALAKLRGARVYGTAGSETRRDALRKMGCVDAFDSHSTDWFSDVMEATNGRGVDVVLNSLAGYHVDLCLDSLAAGGWHCEIGKVDIFANRPMKLAVFRKNLTYRAVDVDRLMMDNPTLFVQLTDECLDLLRHGEVPALPVATYPYADFNRALTCMMNGQHRGKLVLTAPAPQEVLSVVDSRPMFGVGPDGLPRTVLLSGCMGGFGLRILSYVISMGAKHILMLDRDASRQRSVQWLKEAAYINLTMGECEDVQIEVVHADVSKFYDVLVTMGAVHTLGLPPIGSVFHLAGVLDDKMVSDLDAKSFEKVYAPKANGAWNLHRATLGCQELEHFVMLSSISSAFGNPGQTNYSAANAFQDGLAALRRQMGKPALSFCMGAVVETGMASRSPQVLKMMKANGMPAISCIFAVECLDAALRSGRCSNSIAALTTSDLAADVASSDFLRANAQLIRNSAAFKLGGGGSLSKEAIIELVSGKVSDLCGVQDVDPKEPLGSYGLNSISVAELAAFIKQDLSYSVTAMELMTSATCENIAFGVLDASAKVSGIKSSSMDRAASSKMKSSILGTGKRESSLLSQQSPSLFAPSLEEHFDGAENLLPRPIVKAESNVLSSSPAADLGQLDGTIPPPCQDTLDELLTYVKSFNCSTLPRAVQVQEIRSVMLTGATGFMGRHFLADLLDRTDVPIEKVYCPVRAKDDEKAMKRVVTAMMESGTWSEEYRPRIIAFACDLSDDHFGASPEGFDDLAKSIDAVYHIAASLNLSAPFYQMRESNCLPMRPIIRLCLSSRLKHLFLASTLGIFPQYFCQFGNEMADKPIERDAMPEMSLMKRIFPLVIGGYAWSKMINELVSFSMARTKGIPLACFRLPVMFVNGRTGYTAAHDPLLRMGQGYLQTGLNAGLMPLVMEDSDICGKMLLNISLNPNRQNIIYHISRQSHRVFTECSFLAMGGYRLKTTTYPEFREVSQKLGTDSPLYVYWLMYDHFAPYWFQYWQGSGQFPIDIGTVEDDHPGPLAEKPNALTLLKDYRAWALKNEHLWPYDISYMDISLDMDTVLEPARGLCTKYGLDFNEVMPNYVLDGLSRICDEVDAPSRVMPTVVFDLTSKLETRVHLYRLIQQYPEIEQEEIKAPVFILGLNRTGTTALHRMLIASGCMAAPHLEEQFLLPRTELMAHPTKESAGEHVGYVRSAMDELITSLRGIHEMGVGVPEEELGPHSHACMSLEYDILYGLPQYREWLDSQTLEEVYKEHLRWVKCVTWSRRRAGKPVTRWCLKLPWHARSLPALMKTYPDALLIHTHRAAKEVAGSWFSLVDSQRRRFYDNADIDRTKLGEEQLATMAETLNRAMSFREEHPELEERWLDLYFSDICSSPLGTVKRVLDHAGIEMDEAITDSLSLFIDESTAQHKKSKKHKYDIRDYGIQADAFDRGVFKEYRAAHSGKM